MRLEVSRFFGGMRRGGLTTKYTKHIRLRQNYGGQAKNGPIVGSVPGCSEQNQPSKALKR